jgi:hypothetical protein
LKLFFLTQGYIAQQVLGSSDSPASVTQVARTIGTHYYNQQNSFFLKPLSLWHFAIAVCLKIFDGSLLPKAKLASAEKSK